MNQGLSAREVQILKLIISEHTTSEIAELTCLSKDTVKTHRRNLLAKLNARNVAGLVRRAFQYRYVSIDFCSNSGFQQVAMIIGWLLEYNWGRANSLSGQR